MQKFTFISVVMSSFILMIQTFSFGQSNNFEKHVNVAMRLIGHELLLAADDSVSLVLPVDFEENNFSISFSNDVYFETDQLRYTIDSILKATEIAKHYLVEVKDCDSAQVVYSYEYGNLTMHQESQLFSKPIINGIMPCQGRDYPLGCYIIAINVLEYYDNDNFNAVKRNDQVMGSSTDQLSYTWSFIFVGIIILLIFGVLYLRKNKTQKVVNTHLVKIGSFIFDSRNTELSIGKNKIELTHKESELLQLLNNTVNKTVVKEIILKEVWGDEGDYVGRTLDVFISKLRKKMEQDPLVKIVNVRGVGYKLVVNN